MARNSNGSGTAAVAGSVTAALASVAAQAAALATAQTAALEQANARLAEINTERDGLIAQIRELGGSAPRASGTRGRGRPRGSTGSRASNDVSLITAVATHMLNAKGPQTVTQVCEGVQKQGYTTDSDNFSTMVSQSLSRLKALRMGTAKSALVQNPDRGQWTAGSGLAAYLKNPDAAVAVVAA